MKNLNHSRWVRPPVIAGLVLLFLHEHAHAVIGDSGNRLLDIGSVRAGDTAVRELVIKNPGEMPFTIKDVSTSCSSLRVTGAAKSIPQNGSGMIMVEFRPLHSGHADLQMLVETDRATDSLMTLRWSGEVLPAGVNDQQPVGFAGSNILVGVADFGNAFKGNDQIILDIRQGSRFDLNHIEGAVNFPLWTLKGMEALKNKSVALVGAGNDDTSLVREAIALQQLGFESIRVLQGGIRAWVLAGLPVTGSDLDTTQTALIDPLDFLSSPQDGWLILETNSGPSAKNTIPGSARVLLSDNPGKQLSEGIRKAGQLKSAPSKVLIVSPQGEKYQIIEKALPHGLSLPVFYLNGGAKAYREVSAQWDASLHRRELTLAGLPASSAAAPGAAILRSNQGCSSCPGKGGRR